MKRNLQLIVFMLLVSACSKQFIHNEPEADPWNGYRNFLKAGEQVHTLWAGQNINIGTVTYGIDDDANFYATYDCSLSGWLISETHLFAGDKAVMPLNKPGAPKIGLFPYSAVHQPRVSVFTFRVPLSELPPCTDPGFVVAAHGVAHSPTNQTETAWAEGSYTFSDKGWGWYDDFYYTPPPTLSIILYGTTFTCDTLRLYHIDVVTGEADIILEEFVGNTSGTYDGAAYDPESGMFFFSNYSTQDLWVNRLNSEDPSFSAGSLNGTAASGTFYDGAYYYVDEAERTINQVTFFANWAIDTETVLDTLPSLVIVNDIAMNPDGQFLYILGQYNGGGVELITWEVCSQTFYTLSIPIREGAQIAFGSDGELYAIAPLCNGCSNSQVFLVDLAIGTLTNIDDEIILILDQPFSDLSMGP